ncbi:hypothetical protein BKA69DRAFT_1048925 [Paraphysoderma sedebokerense]|nr:hypothetical protein BKA69DRAFT_1048925 [Paraphysoderma sedebokerense]
MSSMAYATVDQESFNSPPPPPTSQPSSTIQPSSTTPPEILDLRKLLRLQVYKTTPSISHAPSAVAPSRYVGSQQTRKSSIEKLDVSQVEARLRKAAEEMRAVSPSIKSQPRPSSYNPLPPIQPLQSTSSAQTSIDDVPWDDLFKTLETEKAKVQKTKQPTISPSDVPPTIEIPSNIIHLNQDETTKLSLQLHQQCRSNLHIRHFLSQLFSANIRLNPTIIRDAISVCRSCKDIVMAYSIIEQLKRKGLLSFVECCDSSVYNELMKASWELEGQLSRLALLIQEMQSSGMRINKDTIWFLKSVKDKIERQGNELAKVEFRELVEGLNLTSYFSPRSLANMSNPKSHRRRKL